MFGEMRRKKQALPLETCEKILERGTSGVLAWREKRAILMQSPSVIFTRSKRFFSTVPEMDISWKP